MLLFRHFQVELFLIYNADYYKSQSYLRRLQSLKHTAPSVLRSLNWKKDVQFSFLVNESVYFREKLQQQQQWSVKCKCYRQEALTEVYVNQHTFNIYHQCTFFLTCWAMEKHSYCVSWLELLQLRRTQHGTGITTPFKKQKKSKEVVGEHRL